MWLIGFLSFIIGACISLLIPFFAAMIFIALYSLPYLLWAAFEIRKPGVPDGYVYEAGPIKLFIRSTRFYFELIRFKKPTLK